MSTKIFLKLFFAVSLVIIVGSFYRVPSSHAVEPVPNWQATGSKATGTTTASVGWPTHVAYDIGLLVIETNSQVATEGTSGWTEVTNSPQDATGSRLTVFWKRAASGAESNATVNVTTGNHIIAYIATFRGVVQSGDPWDVTAGGVLTPAGTTVTFTGVTTTVANALIVAIASNGVDSNTAQSSGWTNAALGSPAMAEVADLSTNAGDGGGIGIGVGGKGSAGATGNTTATIGSSVSGWMHIALKPPVVLLPVVTTEAATSITSTTAVLNSTVNPGGGSTQIRYWYSATYVASCIAMTSYILGPVVSGTATLSGVATQATLSITTNSAYYFCVDAWNSTGNSADGARLYFEGLKSPSVTTTAGTNISAESVTLNSTVYPQNSSTDVTFRYGTSNVACASLPSTIASSTGLTGNNPTYSTAVLPTPTPNIPYYFCVTAVNGIGTSYGSVLSFTYTLSAPAVTTSASNEIIPNYMVFNSSITPNGASTNVNYLYGTANVACASLPNTLAGPVGIVGQTALSSGYTQAIFTTATPGTPYYFCATATNSQGTTYGTVTSGSVTLYGGSTTVAPVETITNNSAIGVGFADAGATTRGICYSLVSVNTNPQSGGSGVTCTAASAPTDYPTKVSVGWRHTCMLMSIGSVNCWGYNDSYQAGARGGLLSNPMTYPALVLNNDTYGVATDLAAGYLHNCALITGGTVYCWGDNNNDQVVPYTGTLKYSTPQLVSGINNATQVSAGNAHSCARLSDSTIKCWGNNTYGQTGTSSGSGNPVLIPNISTATKVFSYGNTNCALLADTTITCWGDNTYGQVGTGNTTTPQSTPVAVSGVTGVIDVSVGLVHTCVILTGGTVKCWGDNTYGQVGTGNTTTPQLTPVLVSGITTATSISVGASHTCVTLTGGTIKCWGDNTYGQTGNGNNDTPQLTPVLVSGITTATSINTTSHYHMCALLSDNSLKCWGNNNFAQTGIGSSATAQLTPFPMFLGSRLEYFRVNLTTLTANTAYTYNAYSSYPSGTVYSSSSNSVDFTTYGSPSVTLPTSSSIGNTTATLGGTVTANQAAITNRGVCYSVTATNANPQSGGAGVTCASKSATTITALSQGGGRNGHYCAVESDGIVSCWGYNTYNQLGDGSGINQTTPVTVVGITNATAVTTGTSHTCALISDGTVKCWGYNVSGQLGNGASGSTNTPPVSVSGITTATQITSGASHTCARLSDSTVKCWGGNTYGQVGTGNTTTPQLTPVAVTGITNATLVSAGDDHTCARLSDSTVKCWGKNDYGQVGTGDVVTPQLTPVAVTGITNASTVSAAYLRACALISDGTVKCWGNNQNGQSPAQASGISTATAVTTGTFFTCASLSDSTVKCFGYGARGQLGNGAGTSTSTPVSVSNITTSTSTIEAGEETSCALITGGTVQCWGDNSYGQLGANHSTAMSTTPVVVLSGVGAFTMPVTGLTVNTAYSFNPYAVDAWGTGYTNPAGVFSTITLTTPTVTTPTVTSISDTTATLGGNNTANGGGAIKDRGVCYSTTLANANPQKNGSGVTCKSAAQPAIPVSISAGAAHSCVLLADGTVKCWGKNDSGQVGTGDTTTPQSTPVTVSGITNAEAVVVGANFSCALLADGTVKCWGDNTNGQVGTGNTTTPQLTPVAVAGVTARKITAGNSHVCFLPSSAGGMKCWGLNASGQLGNNSTSQSLTPVSVVNVSIGTSSEIDAGANHTCALTSNKIQCWGLNTYGQVGNGNTTTPVLYPTNGVYITGITTATKIAAGDNHTCARLSDNTVKCWGLNTSGQIGTGNTTSPQLTPVVASGVSTATEVSVGDNHSCASLSNNTVKCWGLNTSGQIGTGNTTSPKSTPTAVSGVTTASSTGGGATHSCAILYDSSIKCWGLNTSGQVGDGTVASPKSTAVSVISMTASGVFTALAFNLTAGTGYSYNAYASNASFTGYTSPAGTFTTTGVGGNPPPATGCTMNTTGDITISDPCLIPIDGLVYNTTNVIKVMGSDTGTIALAADMTINAGTVVVWGPGKQITRAPGVSMFNSTGSQITQKYICFYDPDNDTVPNDYQLVSQGGTAVLQNTGTCGAGYLRPSSLNATFSSFNTAAYDLAPLNAACYTSANCL